MGTLTQPVKTLVQSGVYGVIAIVGRMLQQPQFLMPEELLWSVYPQLGTDIAALAQYLRLSRTAVAWRLRELGLHTE